MATGSSIGFAASVGGLAGASLARAPRSQVGGGRRVARRSRPGYVGGSCAGAPEGRGRSRPCWSASRSVAALAAPPRSGSPEGDGGGSPRGWHGYRCRRRGDGVATAEGGDGPGGGCCRWAGCSRPRAGAGAGGGKWQRSWPTAAVRRLLFRDQQVSLLADRSGLADLAVRGPSAGTVEIRRHRRTSQDPAQAARSPLTPPTPRTPALVAADSSARRATYGWSVGSRQVDLAGSGRGVRRRSRLTRLGRDA